MSGIVDQPPVIPPDVSNPDRGAAPLDTDYQLPSSHSAEDALKEFRRNRDAKKEPPVTEKKTDVVDPNKAKDEPQKKVEQKQVVDPNKKGSDGLTSDERKSLLDYKTKAEVSEARIKELEDKMRAGESTLRERDEYKKKVEELEGKSKEWESKFNDTRKEFDGWMSKQDKIALEKVKMSEAYEQRIEIPTRQTERDIAELFKGTDIKPDDVLRIHYSSASRVERNKALSEIKSNLDDESRLELTELLRNLEQIDRMAEEVHKNPQGSIAALQDAEKQREAMRKDKESRDYKNATDRVRESLISEEFPMVVKDKSTYDRIKEKADSIDWSNMPMDKKSYLAHGAFIATELRDAYERLEGASKSEKEAAEKKIAELEATVAKLTNKPGPGGGSPIQKSGSPSVNGDDAIDRLSTEDRARQAPWRRQGLQ